MFADLKKQTQKEMSGGHFVQVREVRISMGCGEQSRPAGVVGQEPERGGMNSVKEG